MKGSLSAEGFTQFHGLDFYSYRNAVSQNITDKINTLRELEEEGGQGEHDSRNLDKGKSNIT